VKVVVCTGTAKVRKGYDVADSKAKHDLTVTLRIAEYEGDGIPVSIQASRQEGQTLGLDGDGDVYLVNVYGDAFVKAVESGDYSILGVAHLDYQCRECPKGDRIIGA
jgi:hypothetical protein